MDAVTLVMAQSYTDETLKGMGALKGKNCVIESITEKEYDIEVLFKWTLDDGTVQRKTMLVPKGAGAGAFIIKGEFNPTKADFSEWSANISSTYDEVVEALEKDVFVFGALSYNDMTFNFYKSTDMIGVDGDITFICNTNLADIPPQLKLSLRKDGTASVEVAENESVGVLLVTAEMGNETDGKVPVENLSHTYEEIVTAYEEGEYVYLSLSGLILQPIMLDRNMGCAMFVGKMISAGSEIIYSLYIYPDNSIACFVNNPIDELREETEEKIRKAEEAANTYTDEQIEKMSIAEAISVDEKPVYVDGVITYIKGGETFTLEEGNFWFYYYDEDGLLVQTIWIDDTEHTLSVGDIDLTEYVKKTSIAMPKENETDPDPVYKPDDILSIALFNKFKNEFSGAYVVKGEFSPTTPEFSSFDVTIQSSYDEVLSAINKHSVYCALSYNREVFNFYPSMDMRDTTGDITFIYHPSSQGMPQLKLTLRQNGITSLEAVVKESSDAFIFRGDLNLTSDTEGTVDNLSATYDEVLTAIKNGSPVYCSLKYFDEMEFLLPLSNTIESQGAMTFVATQQLGGDSLLFSVNLYADGRAEFSMSPIAGNEEKPVSHVNFYYTSDTEIKTDADFYEIFNSRYSKVVWGLMLTYDRSRYIFFDIESSATDKIVFKGIDREGEKTHEYIIIWHSDGSCELKKGKGNGVADGNPVGTVTVFAGMNPPEGYLLCDGAEVSRTEYAKLFSAIGETYGAGDGSTTFNLPDLTDKFVQGIGANTLGTTMEAGLPNITGEVQFRNVSSAGLMTVGANAKTSGLKTNGGTIPSNHSGYSYTGVDGSSSGKNATNVTLDASRNNAIYGNSETVQPPALVMTYIIKAVESEPYLIELTKEQFNILAEKLSKKKAVFVDEKPVYQDDKIVYMKDGVEFTTEDTDMWFYYFNEGVPVQTIWIDGSEITLDVSGIDMTDYLEKKSVVMPKEDEDDTEPEYKAEDVPSMAMLEKLLIEKGGGGNPVGTVIAFAGFNPPKGYLLCDGKEISRTEYADLFTAIGETYGAGDGISTFNLPDLKDRFVQGTGTSTIGTTKQAGLPNITGNVARLDSGGSGATSASGAFSISKNDSESANSGSGAIRYSVTFNASKSNAIYGKSDTVQPPAVVMTYIIRAVVGEAVENDYVAGDGIEINPTTTEDGKEVFEISCTQGFNITGQLRGSSEIVSLDKTFAEIKAAIEAEKNVTLYIFEEGLTENPYVFTPSVILADTINFSLVYGVNVIDMFMLMSVDINSDDTYTVNSKIMQKELVAGDGIKIEPKTTEKESESGEIVTREVLEISSDAIIESPLELPDNAQSNKLYHTYSNYITSEFGVLINGEFRRYSGFTPVQTLPTTNIIETNVYLIPGTSWNIYDPTESKWYTYDIYSSTIEVSDFSEIEEPADNKIYKLLKKVHKNKIYKFVDGAWLGYEPEFFPAGTLKMVDDVTVHDPDLDMDKTSRQLKGFSVERRKTMPTDDLSDPIEEDILYVDETNGATDEEAALLKRYAPGLSNANDGYLRYMPVDSFIKPIDTMSLLSDLTITPPAPQSFVIADSLLYLQGYFKSSQTFSSVGWHPVCEFDLATIGYEWAGLEEGMPIRTLISVWLDGAYVNSAISVYNVTGSQSSGRFTLYVTSGLVNKAIAFNLNVMLPVRKLRA